MNDTYVEYTEVPDGTSQEMVAFYMNHINKAYAEVRSGISKRYQELMEVTCTGDYKLEFKGQVFVCTEWRTVKFATKEEFFKEESE